MIDFKGTSPLGTKKLFSGLYLCPVKKRHVASGMQVARRVTIVSAISLDPSSSSQRRGSSCRQSMMSYLDGGPCKYKELLYPRSTTHPPADIDMFSHWARISLLVNTRDSWEAWEERRA